MSELAGKGCEIIVPFDERQPLKDIERSIIKKYRKHLWSKFIKAIRDYNLVEEGDKIAVAISGGKDSLLMAKMFQELKRHGQVNFEVEFIAMDPGYHKDIKQLLIDNHENSFYMWRKRVCKPLERSWPDTSYGSCNRQTY